MVTHKERSGCLGPDKTINDYVLSRCVWWGGRGQGFGLRSGVEMLVNFNHVLLLSEFMTLNFSHYGKYNMK